jgi:hypothetical protein
MASGEEARKERPESVEPIETTDADRQAMTDIFEFWSQVKRGERIHPADKEAFRRMGTERHGFKLECLPGCFAGRLRTAPIVLLYLSPGYDAATAADAEKAESQEYRKRSYGGDEPFRDHGPGRTWLASRTNVFGDYESIKSHFATLNIGAYHSKALPSSRVALTWAQDYLFPEAEAGNRIVICMRSAAYWGLQTGGKYSGTLFAPQVTRSGRLVGGPDKAALVDLVRARISSVSH